MSQHDFIVENQTGALVRADFNNALLAIATNSSGASAPSTPYSFQMWLDTTNNLLMIRDAANTSWISLGTPSVSNLGMMTLNGATATGALLAFAGTEGAPGISFSGDADNGIYKVSDGVFGLVANGTEYVRVSASGVTFLGTGASTVPTGTTAQRPTPTAGMIRYNSDLGKVEAYVNGAWRVFGSTSTYPFINTDFVNASAAQLGAYDFSGVGTTSKINVIRDFSSFEDHVFTIVGGHPTGSEFIDISPSGEFLISDTTTAAGQYQISAGNVDALGTISSGINDGKWSHSGQYFAFARSATTTGLIYKRDGTSTTPIATASMGASAFQNGVDWSPNDQLLTFAHAVSPYMTTFERVGDVFTALAAPATNPASTAYSVAWSPNGRFCAIGTGVSPYLFIYELTGRTTLTLLVSPLSANPAGLVQNIQWSPDSRFLACAHNNSPFVTIYDRSNVTFTKVSNPSTLPAGGGLSVAWHPSGDYLIVGNNNSPYYVAYSRSGSTFTAITNLGTVTAPTAALECSVFSKDGQFFYFVQSGVNTLKIWRTYSGLEMADSSVMTIRKKYRAGT